MKGPGGDPIRQVGPPPGPMGWGRFFWGLTGKKRSIVMNLKHLEGRETFYQLVEEADIVVHNMRAQAAERLSIDYSTLRGYKPDIIYCGTYGFRQSGPYGKKPAFDDMIQAASGLAHLQGRGGKPHYITSAIADKITATTVAMPSVWR
ncbi:MAG: hypothetical protein CM1200mP41_30730 [Gammaproteobacteria bacterium]|nr:MAG: hypothetical protein CM1200mP41_30730 [Gammaproteobacteria bacterium]